MATNSQVKVWVLFFFVMATSSLALGKLGSWGMADPENGLQFSMTTGSEGTFSSVHVVEAVYNVFIYFPGWFV